MMSMERYEEALRELEVVRDNVPKESAVYFLMGKVIGPLSSRLRDEAAMMVYMCVVCIYDRG